jgi:hypothetical protein
MDDDQPWDGTERRSGRDRRKKDRWILEGEEATLNDRRAPFAKPTNPRQ